MGRAGQCLLGYGKKRRVVSSALAGWMLRFLWDLKFVKHQLDVQGDAVRFSVRVCLTTVATAFLPIHAETLRCNGHIVETGDSRLSVRRHCGEPLLQDAYCAPVYYSPGFQPVPDSLARAVVPCLIVDEWLYDRGPGNLAATVRLRAGSVLSITYGDRTTP